MVWICGLVSAVQPPVWMLKHQGPFCEISTARVSVLCYHSIQLGDFDTSLSIWNFCCRRPSVLIQLP